MDGTKLAFVSVILKLQKRRARPSSLPGNTPTISHRVSVSLRMLKMSQFCENSELKMSQLCENSELKMSQFCENSELKMSQFCENSELKSHSSVKILNLFQGYGKLDIFGCTAKHVGSRTLPLLSSGMCRRHVSGRNFPQFHEVSHFYITVRPAASRKPCWN